MQLLGRRGPGGFAIVVGAAAVPEMMIIICGGGGELESRIIGTVVAAAQCRCRSRPPCQCRAGSPRGRVLPSELLFEVLLLLPAKEVCRVRAVCSSWRSLTYDPIFVSAHAARRPGPLLAVPSGWLMETSVDLVDLSGDVVKRIRTGDRAHRVLCTHFNYVFIVSGVNHSVHILEPVSGAVFTLPHAIGEDLARVIGAGYPAWFAFGQVASTQEYKLMRIVEDRNGGDPACEVFTFDTRIAQWNKSPETYRQWKKTGSPPAYLDPGCTNGVVVNGSAYFLFDCWQFDEPFVDGFCIEPGCIPSFNLETEHWSVALQGPLSRILQETVGLFRYEDLADRLSLAGIEGCLVTVHCNDQMSTTDLWFLIDFDNCVWSKKTIIQNEVLASNLTEAVQVLWVPDVDGMILLVRTVSGLVLRIYDPATNAVRNVFGTNFICSAGVGIYTQSLLMVP
ncbi:hypothetical protein EJB05_14852, partial [Eragrostis curvula]